MNLSRSSNRYLPSALSGLVVHKFPVRAAAARKEAERGTAPSVST